MDFLEWRALRDSPPGSGDRSLTGSVRTYNRVNSRALAPFIRHRQAGIHGSLTSKYFDGIKFLSVAARL